MPAIPMTSTDYALVAQWSNSYGAVIDPNIVSRVPIDAPLVDRLQQYRKQNNGLAAVFTTLTALDLCAGEDGTFPEGMCPPDLSVSKEKDAVVKKSIGFKSGLTDVALTATVGRPRGIMATQIDGKKFADEKALLVNQLYAALRQAEDWQIIRGDNVGNHLNGLENQVSCTVDYGGAALEKAMIDENIVIMLSMGILPTAIYVHPLMGNAIINHYVNLMSVNINTGEQRRRLGVYANEVVTPAGVLPLIQDRRFTVGGNSPNFCLDIWLVTETYRGSPILYMEDQIPPTYVDLGRAVPYCTSMFFFVWEHTAFVNRGGSLLHRRLCNIGVSVTDTLVIPTPTPVGYD